MHASPFRGFPSLPPLAHVGLLVLFLIAGTDAPAQRTGGGARPPPHIGYVYPAGTRQGTTVAVTLGGQNFGDPSAVRVSGGPLAVRITGHERPPTQKEINELRTQLEELQKKRAAGVAFTAAERAQAAELRTALANRQSRRTNPALAESVTLEITVPPDTGPGECELRLQAGAGLSNPVVFRIGTLPEFAAPVVTIAGTPDQLRPAGRPTESAADRTPLVVTLPAVVNGQILPGEVDRIRFTARAGQQLVAAVAARALIPYLADAVPGWFQAAITLRDPDGREIAYEDDFAFRPDPVLACRIARDGDYVLEIKDAIYRGRQDFVYRVTLGEAPFVTSLFPLGATRGQPTMVSLTGWNLPSDRMTLDPAQCPPGDRLLLSVRNQTAGSNTVRFALDAQPDCFEAAGSRDPTGQPVECPAIVNGRIDRPGERDTYAFTATAGTTVVAEIVARRLDSPLDSNLTLLDAAGRTLAGNDDFEDKGEGLLTHQADSRISFTLAEAGTYRVVVADAQARGGPTYGYRLHLGPPRPDFSLRVVPSALNLRAGGCVPLTVYALRHDGFTGDIKLGLRAAPPGYTLHGATIPAGLDKIQLTLTAPPPPVEAPATLELVGAATLDGRPVTRVAVPADDVMQAFLYRHLVPARELAVTVTGRAPVFRLSTRAPVRLVPGQAETISVAVNTAGAAEPPLLELVEPPPGLTLGPATWTPGGFAFDVRCDPGATRGQHGNLIVAVSGTGRGKAASPAGAQTQRRALGTLPAIPFEIADAGK